MLFTFGVLPILFSAAFCTGLVEMPKALAKFGGKCRICAQQG